MSYRGVHLVPGASLLVVLPKLQHSVGVEPGGCIGDNKAGRWEAMVVFADLSVYNHDVVSCFLSRKGTCSWVVMELVNLHSIGGIKTVPRAAVEGPV